MTKKLFKNISKNFFIWIPIDARWCFSEADRVFLWVESLLFFSAFRWRKCSFENDKSILALFLFCFDWYFLISCQKYSLDHIIWFRKEWSISLLMRVEGQSYFKKIFHLSSFSEVFYSMWRFLTIILHKQMYWLFK